MKWCSKGQHEAPREGFNKSGKSKDGLNAWCKACLKQYERERWLNGDSLRKQKNKEASVQRARDYVWSYLCSNKCVDCPVDDPQVLQFDHRNPAEKLYNVGEMVGRGFGIEAIQAEIDKCDIRCANCHIKRTMDQFNWWKLNLDRV